MKKLAQKLIAASLVLASSAAFAGSATANFQVTATVSASCAVSATNVAFGTITPAATGTAAATGTITSTCTKTTPYTLNLNAGNSGVFTGRTMAGSTGNTDALAYNLYTESAYTNVFGDNSTGTKNVGLTGTGAAQTTTVYGSLSLNQYLKPDTYSDTLTVTLSY